MKRNPEFTNQKENQSSEATNIKQITEAKRQQALQKIMIIFNENNLKLKSLPEGTSSLFRALSDALFYNQDNYEILQKECCKKLHEILTKKDLQYRRLQNVYGNYSIYQDYFTNPNLPGFEKIFEDNYLTNIIINHGFERQVEIIRSFNNHFDSVYPINTKSEFLQINTPYSVLYQSANSYLVQQPQLCNKQFQETNNQINLAQNKNELVVSQYAGSIQQNQDCNDQETTKDVRPGHKKSLSDQFGTEYLDKIKKQLSQRKRESDVSEADSTYKQVILDDEKSNQDMMLKIFSIKPQRSTESNKDITNNTKQIQQNETQTNVNPYKTQTFTHIVKNTNLTNTFIPTQIPMSPVHFINTTPPGLTPPYNQQTTIKNQFFASSSSQQSNKGDFQWKTMDDLAKNNSSFNSGSAEGEIGFDKKKPIILDEGRERYTGTIKFFDETKNYGFIIMDEDGSDIFVHYDDLQKAQIDKEILKTVRAGNIIKLSFACMQYIGKYNKSKKAVEIEYLPSY